MYPFPTAVNKQEFLLMQGTQYFPSSVKENWGKCIENLFFNADILSGLYYTLDEA